jgi:hypothetical protein
VSSFKLIDLRRGPTTRWRCVMQDARSLQERLLRLAQQAALGEEATGRPPHREDPRDPQQEPRDLRISEGARRASLARDRLRPKASGEVNESRRTSRLCEG